MFELRNKNQVWYKSDDMYDWVHYGNLIITEHKMESKNILEIKKFNFDTHEYDICNDFSTYLYNGKEYLVTDGCFEIEEEAQEEPEPSEAELIQAEMLLNQAEIIAKQNEHDEVLAEILLGQQMA